MKRSLFVVAAFLALQAGTVAAQGRMDPKWERPGFDFSPNGVWRAKVRRIREARARLLSQGNLAALNAARTSPAGSALVLNDTLLVPALLLRYKNTDTTALPFLGDTAQYSSALFSSSPPFSRPYTVRTFYEQMTNGLFSMQGRVIGWAHLDSNEVFYTDDATCGGNCNGINSTHAVMRMQTALRETLIKMDASVDFGLFDNDGPDGIPNSGDDDGYVDMAMFVHPTRDGACGGNPHIWSHRFVLVDTTSGGSYVYHDYVTNDPWNGHPGQFIKVRDYFVTSGVGGSTACDSTQMISIGTAAHESGHGLGLPDLYDTQGSSEGIGSWGLMGSGNYTSPLSPSRMEAWSLSQFGWVTLAPITTNGTYSFGPAPTSDSAWIIRPTGSNPRGEYFLLENRQAVQSDSALIHLKGPGLMIWHVDSEQVTNNGFSTFNTVNSGPIHGVRLEEADGLGQLMSGTNRGDAGDPYPGTSNNTVFSYNTNPANVKNSDGTFAGFQVDSIKQLSPVGPMSFRVQFGGFSLVRASDSSATVQFDSVNYNVFRGLLANASSHEVGVADTQFTNAGRNRFRYQSWSDAGARVHAISGTFAGETLIATLAKDFKTQIATVGTGTVVQSPAADATGFVPSGSPDTLTATPGSGLVFDGWAGDTTGSNPVLVLPMGRPFNITVLFDSTLAMLSGTTRPNGVMGAPYNDTLRVTGGGGSSTDHWHVVSGALPAGVSLALTGELFGFPKQTGDFTYTARDTSRLQNTQGTFTFSVAAPTLLTADVVTQLFTGTSALNADQLRYLDYLGNNNFSFDVGDFLAWVNATGAPLAAPQPAVANRSRRMRKGGRP